MKISLPPILSYKRRRLLLHLLMVAVLQALATIATTLLVRYIFDNLRHLTDGHQIIWACGGLIIAACASAWMQFRNRVVSEALGQDYVYELRMTLYQRLSSLAPRALQRRAKGSILLRFMGDLTALRQWVSLGAARLMVAIVVISLAFVTLALIDWPQALAAGSIMAGGMLFTLVVGRSLEEAAREARRCRARLANNMNEKVTSMAVVQVFGQSDRERRRIVRQSLKLQGAMLKRARIIGQLRALTQGTAALAITVVLTLGAYEVMAERITLGTVVAVMTIVRLLVPFLRDLGRVQEYWRGARVAQDKIGSFLAIPGLVDEASDAVPLPNGAGTLEFERASLTGALNHFSARAEAGSVIAIIGPNGAGKSTLLALAARLLDPDDGKIRIDGADLTRVKLDSLRRAVGIVSAELPLLRGSVGRNLRYRWPSAPEAEVARVYRLCGIDEILKQLPEGVNTRVQESGANLSMGQRQRIAFARAILGTPRILLLDEADANLDPKASAIIDRVIADYAGTVLIVTHRADRLAQADCIWHLRDGRLIESGSPETLLREKSDTHHFFQHSAAL